MKHPSIRAFHYLWPGTQNNHAGMTYFAQCLKRDMGLPFWMIENSPKDAKAFNYGKYLAKLTLPWTDCLFFMEYLSPIGKVSQEILACHLRQKGLKKPMVGIVHLPEALLLKTYKMEYLRASLDALDHIISFGSSLTRFLERIGYGSKIKQTFHYVDADYYRPLSKEQGQRTFKVLAFGMLLRNTPLLKEIVEQCPDVTFQICAGIADLKSAFSLQPNVELHGYMPEAELRSKLQHADASLSVLEDTVGSNSIMGGLACGLPQIVSDVGSIRDYCSESNAFFCRNKEDFVTAIRRLKQDQDLCAAMRKNARQRAEALSLPYSMAWFKNFFTEVHHKVKG